MFSVRQIERWTGGLFRPAGRTRAGVDQGWVLPRPLRRPVRFLGRFVKGDVAPPRYSALVLSAVYIGAFSLYGAVLGGHMPAVAQSVTARTGFAVDEITVSGNKEVSEIDVLDQLELTGWTSLVGFDVSAARDRIAKLAWVENASVRKVYPDKIEVELAERKPFALWQHDGQLSVIEPSGRIIAPYTSRSRSSLPIIVGLGAPEAGAAFVAKAAEFPELASRVTTYVRIGDRRWDVKLDNGITIQLPERGVEEAMAKLVSLDKSDRLFSRDVKTIDLRLADRVTVALTDEGQAGREKALKDRAASRKKVGART